MTNSKRWNRIRIAGVLVALGLLGQIPTYGSTSPASFVAFIAVSAGLVGAGILLYLAPLARRRAQSGESTS